jgi:hypothetical protein
VTHVSARSENDYSVQLRQTEQGWRVIIVDGSGATVGERACKDASEARSYASTVRQHIYWLSPEKFKEYYRI